MTDQQHVDLIVAAQADLDAKMKAAATDGLEFSVTVVQKTNGATPNQTYPSPEVRISRRYT
jgi:hypothetical protein